MTRWFTSDTHFGHQNILKYCDRPFNDVSHMNEMLIANWNDAVAPDDEVWHLGDVALGPWVEWDGILTRLNGQMGLIVGNHDRVFAQTKQSMIDKFAPMYAKWFPMGVHSAEMVHLSNGTSAHMSHFPYDGDSHDADRYSDFRLSDDGTPLIHGHTHSNDKVTFSEKGTVQIHVGVDAWDHRPVSEDEIIELLSHAGVTP